MPTKSTTNTFTFTWEEKRLGEKILIEMRKVHGTNREKRYTVAHELGYTGYATGHNPIPKNVRSYISSVAGKVAGIRRRQKNNMKENPVSNSNADVWYEEVAASRSLQHGLHPEDEEALVKYFANT